MMSLWTACVISVDVSRSVSEAHLSGVEEHLHADVGLFLNKHLQMPSYHVRILLRHACSSPESELIVSCADLGAVQRQKNSGGGRWVPASLDCP